MLIDYLSVGERESGESEREQARARDTGRKREKSPGRIRMREKGKLETGANDKRRRKEMEPEPRHCWDRSSSWLLPEMLYLCLTLKLHGSHGAAFICLLQETY